MSHSFRSFFTFLLTSTSLLIYAQAPVELSEVTREIHFADLFQNENAGFNRKNRELGTYICQAIANGKIKAYYINYSEGHSETPISGTPYTNRFGYPSAFAMDMDVPDYYYPSDNLKPRDLNIIGLDIISGTVNGQEYQECLYIHFYTYFSDLEYRFSVKWTEVIAALAQDPSALYFTNSYKNWWRGNVFITAGTYTIDASVLADYVSLGQQHSSFPAENYRTKEAYDLSAISTAIGELTLNECFILEVEMGDGYEMRNIGFELVQEDWAYKSTNDRFTFQWYDFMNIAADSNWRQHSVLYNMSDALIKGELVYADDIETEVVSANGLFRGDDQANPLCRKTIRPNLHLPVQQLEATKFKTRYIENINFLDPLNKPMYDAELIPLIFKYITMGRLQVYNNDSLLTPMSMEDFNARKTVPMEVWDYDESITYKQGEQTWHDRNLYVAKKDVPVKTPPASNSAYWTMIEIPTYDPKTLTENHFTSIVTFDENGEHKKYQMKGIDLFIPAQLNIKGILIPIGSVRWEDLKPLLLKEKKAKVKYNGKKINLATYIESRAFFSYLLNTDVLEVVE